MDTRTMTLAVALTLGCGKMSQPIEERAAAQGIAAGAFSGGRAYSSVAGGTYHVCALGKGGTVYCGGDNQDGQLGDGTTVNRNAPVIVPGLANQVYVAANNSTTCSAGADGFVNCWGLNDLGQLGNGATGGVVDFGESDPTPQQVVHMVGAFRLPLASIVEVAVGSHHACARDATGQIWCWGQNAQGEYGNGTTAVSNMAVPGPSLHAIGIAAGAAHTCALLQDRTVSCWGYNAYGALGNGTTTTSYTPVTVSGLTNVVSISAQNYGNCALLVSGNVACWGYNAQGEIGTGNTVTPQVRATFVLAPSGSGLLSNVVAISRGGQYTTCALVANGSTWCWGYNYDGETGSGTTSYAQPLPVALGATGGAPANEIAVGYGHGCARTADGNFWCWGLNNDGQLGNGTTISSSVPVYNDIPAWTSPAQRLSASDYGACAIDSSWGWVYCWGYNAFGEAGDGTTTQRDAPVRVTGGLQNVIGLAGMRSTNHALRADGTVWSWGDGGGGQLGNDSTSNSSVPVELQVGGGTPLTNVTAIGGHCAVLATGIVYCWGANEYGEVGDGTYTPRLHGVPVMAGGGQMTNVLAVTGDTTRCALKSDGTVWCWGNNNYGALGNGAPYANSPVPVQARGITNAVAVAADDDTTCALLADGTVRCWGDNSLGQLGNGFSDSSSSTPVAVSGLTDAVALSVGVSTLCAIRAGGTDVCWGDNSDYQIDSSGSDRGTPTMVSGLDHLLNVAPGYHTNYALRADGTLWALGSNENGQFGNGTDGTLSGTPVAVSFAP